MKQAKRAISMLLAALTICTMLPMNALAAENDVLFPAGTVVDDDTDEVVEIPAGAVVEEDEEVIEEMEEGLEEEEKPELSESDAWEQDTEEITEEDDFDPEQYEEEVNRIFFDEPEDDPAAIADTEERTPPSRPVAVSIDRTAVTVSSTGKGDIEYSIDNGETWQDSGEFTDLTPGQEYNIIARLKATDDDPATEPSAPLTVSTVPKDTYMVASEEDLQTAFAEVSTLPATQERINIRFTKSITVSDTVVLPKLRGRMELFLDLYGFTLTCTKPNVPVVQIETRATLGSSYYLDSGSSAEKVRGGHLAASGDGMAILISPSAVAKLKGLTFTCGSVAIENQGDLSLMENIHGGMKNSGYIEAINGMNTEYGIENDGTIETIDGCTLGSTEGYDVVYKDGYSEAVPATLINRGLIGTISNTKISGGKLATVLNTKDAKIDALSGENYFRNSNRAMGTVLLNYGKIGCIEDGMYYGQRTVIYNYGEISHVLDGLYSQYHDGYGTEGQVNYKDYFTNLPEDDQAYLLEHGDPVTAIVNAGQLPDVAGGVFVNKSTYFRNYLNTWYADGTNHEGIEITDGTWKWSQVVFPMGESSSYSYRDGYALSRSKQSYLNQNRYAYKNNSQSGNGNTGWKIGKAYTVTYDTTETRYFLSELCLLDNNDGCEHNVTSWYQYVLKSVNGTVDTTAPTTLSYIAGDTVKIGNLPVTDSSESALFAVRYVDGKLDNGQYRYNARYYHCKDCADYIVFDDWSCVYKVYDYQCSNESYSGKENKSFTMPEENLTFTPTYQYREPIRNRLYNDYYTKHYFAFHQCASDIRSNISFEIVTYDGDEIDWKYSDKGCSYALLAEGVQRNPEKYQVPRNTCCGVLFDDRWEYRWSIDKEHWYSDGEVPLTSELLDAAKVSYSGSYMQIPIYMKRIATAGGGDENVVKEAEPTLVITLSIQGLSNTQESVVQYEGKASRNAIEFSVPGGDGKKSSNVRLLLTDTDGSVRELTSKDNVTVSSRYSSYWNGNELMNIVNDARISVSDLTVGQTVTIQTRPYSYKHYGWNQTRIENYNNLIAAAPWGNDNSVTLMITPKAPTSAPTLVSRLDTTITIEADGDLEYSIDGGKTWQKDGTFSNLTPGKDYSIISRYPETDNSYASGSSPALSVSTRETDGVLQAPILESKTETSLTVRTSEGFEFSIDGGETWQKDSTFSGLTFGTEYSILSRKADEPDYISPALKVRTAFSAPVLKSRTDTTLTIETVDGAEYQISGGMSWQTNGTFGNLDPNTEYVITARKTTDHDSLSETLTAKTKNSKAAPSSAPTLEGKTDTEIAVIPESDMEYSNDGGKTWKNDGYFENLTQDTEYEIISRYVETDDCAASPASPALTVLTKFTATKSPVVPTILNITENSIQVEVVDGQEYALREEDEKELVRPWQEEDTFRGLESDTSYEILTRLTETEDTAASSICPTIIVVYTKKYVSLGGSSADEDSSKVLHTPYVYGYEDGTVKPEQKVTRAEAAALFSTAFALDGSVGEESKFSDISVNDWYFAQIQQMADAGYLSGYPDGSFKPEKGMTRAEFVALALKFASKTAGGKKTFIDVDETCWAKDLIEKAASVNLIYGYEDGTFRPEGTITRAEAISIINVLLGRLNHCARDNGVTRSYFSDNQDQFAWYYHAILEASTPHIVSND